MKLRPKSLPITLLALFAVMGVLVTPIRADDHLDGPAASSDGRLDLTALYAFQSPSDSSHTVLVLGVNPLAGVLSPTPFSPDASYEFKVDSNGDAREDLTYKLTFSAVNGGAQNVTLRRVPAGGKGAVLARGQTGQNIVVSGGGTLRTGVFDDPAFFDLVAFRNGLAFCPGGVGTNFFAGLNITAIVLEVPSASFGTTNIGVWARTALGDQQIDRVGRPDISTFFLHTDARKDAFNAGKPKNDQRDFHADVYDTLIALGNTPAYAEVVTNILLPDTLTFNTSSAAGYLNGRRLADDVVDIELSVFTNGAITTDCVANDSNFSNTFPYLAAAN